MELNIVEKREGNALVLILTGDLVMNTPNTDLRDSVRNALSDGVREITFDLAGLERLDSIGVGELISSMIAVSREGGRFVLLNPSDRTNKLLAISGMFDIFDVRHA